MRAVCEMSQQPTSLLSLPDELLVQIFDYLGGRFSKGVDPILPLTLVCRRISHLAQAVLYRYIVLAPDSRATRHLHAVIGQNPLLGQLIDTLTISGTGSDSDSDIDEEAIHDWELVQATASAVSNLKELILSDMTTEEASAILAALPSTSLHNLSMRFCLLPASFRWSDLWAHVARFSELRVLTCQDWHPATETAPRAAAHTGQHIPLPQLVKLQLADYGLIRVFGAPGTLRQTLPKLRELQITIYRSDDSSAVTAILSEAPSTLMTLRLLPYTGALGIPRQYLPTLPALCRLTHLDLGPGTFIEAELLIYLATAPLESIRFDFHALVTDRILQALTGPARPLQLRQICLDHVFGTSMEEIRNHLKFAASEGETVEEVRRQLCPEWPTGGTEQGLRHALAAANANGLEVTGSALACADWDATFDEVLVDFMMEQAHKTDDYGDVIARFGEEVAVAWLEEHAPNTVRLLHAHMNALELDNVVP